MSLLSVAGCVGELGAYVGTTDGPPDDGGVSARADAASMKIRTLDSGASIDGQVSADTGLVQLPGADAAADGSTDAGDSRDATMECRPPSAIRCDAGCAGTSLYTPCSRPPEPIAVPTPVADECITTVVAADKVVFKCDGYAFTTSIPASCVHTACGLIFDVHGLTQNADLQEQATELAALGRDNGYIVVQPSSPTASWSTTDRAPIWRFLQRVVRVFHVDSHRVHFTGYSQGGDFTWWALCEHSDELASVAPNNMPNSTGPYVNPQCFNSGEKAGPLHKLPILYSYGATEPTLTAAQFEASVDAIKKDYSLVGDGDIVATDADGKFVVKGFTNADGVRFEYMVHKYSGAFGQHCIPGGGKGSTSCAAPMDIHWGKYMLKFFIDHPRP